MQKILVALPDGLADRMRIVIPNRHRSRVITELLEHEIEKREKELYNCACQVEADEELNREMADWDITTGENIEPETW